MAACGPHHHERGRAHAAGDHRRLADVAILARDQRVAGGEGAGGALAVDQQRPAVVLLELGDVVGHVVDQLQVVVAQAKEPR